MERLRSHGLLTQFLTSYVTAGGQDPRVETASSLIKDGVPLERELKKISTASRNHCGGLTPAMVYAKRMTQREKEQNDMHVTLAEYRHSWDVHYALFRTLDQSEQDKYIRMVEDLKAERRLRDCDVKKTS